MAATAQQLLDFLRRQLDMDVVFLSLRARNGWVIRDVAARGNSPGLPRAGQPQNDASAHLQRDFEHGPGRVVPDSGALKEDQRLPLEAAGIRGYLGVPVLNGSGGMYGALCAYSHSPRPHLSTRDLRALEAMASALYDVIEAADLERARRSAARDEVTRVIQGFATSGDSLSTAWQPVHAIGQGVPVGFEALSRFTVDGAPVPPDLLIAKAHDAGVGNRLEVECFKRASDQRIQGVDIGINLSAAALMSELFAELVADWDHSAWCDVVIELTEHERVEDYEELHAALRPARQKGARLAVDDFGAGFASVKHVLELEADILKLDRALVTDLPNSPRRQAIVSGLLLYAASTDTVVIAEGVEHEAELEVLADLGVSLVQGYLLGRPTVGPLSAYL